MDVYISTVAGEPARSRTDAQTEVPSSLEEPVGLLQIRPGRLLLTRLKPTEIIESRLLGPFLRGRAQFHFMPDEFHLMPDKFHFMTEPTCCSLRNKDTPRRLAE